MEWISVQERLPVQDALYLIHAPSLDEKSPLIITAWYDPKKGEWSGLVPYWRDAVTHWMALPDPPKD